MASGPPNPSVSPTNPADARLRIGVVQASPAPQADFVWVLVDGTVIQAAYFVGYMPIPGDRVTVTQAGSDWFVVGGKSGGAGNLVINPTFTGHGPFAPDLTPFNWTKYVASGGGATVQTYFTGQFGLPAAEFVGIGGGDTYLASAAFPVTPGQVLDCSSSGLSLGVSANAPFEMRLAWFSSGQGAYPAAVVQADTVVASHTILTTETGFTFPLSGLATTPAKVSYARLVLRVTAAATYDVAVYFAGVYG